MARPIDRERTIGIRAGIGHAQKERLFVVDREGFILKFLSIDTFTTSPYEGMTKSSARKVGRSETVMFTIALSEVA